MLNLMSNIIIILLEQLSKKILKCWNGLMQVVAGALLGLVVAYLMGNTS